MDTSTPHDTGGPTPPPPGPSGTDTFFASVRRLGVVRTDDRWIGGVAGGVAQRFGLDPVLARGLFVVAALLSGIGLVLYGLAWALLPEQRDGRIHAEEMVRGHFDIAMVGTFVAVGAGLSSPNLWNPMFWWFGDWYQGWNVFGWVVGTAAVVALVVAASRGASSRSGFAADSGADSGAGAAPTPPPPAPTASTEGPAMPGPTTDPARDFAPAGAAPATAYRLWGPTPPAETPATLPRRRPSGPGAAAVGVVVGLTLLVLAGLLYAERIDAYDGPVALTTLAVGVVLAGLTIVVSGLRGRTSGSLGGLAVIGILVGVPFAGLNQTVWTWNDHGTAVGNMFETPQSVSAAERGFSVGAGQARIDLTELPWDDVDRTVEVPISVGAGDVFLVLPEDVDYRAELRVIAGEITARTGEERHSGVGRSTTVESPSVVDGATPDLLVRVTVAAGQIRVVEE